MFDASFGRSDVGVVLLSADGGDEDFIGLRLGRNESAFTECPAAEHQADVVAVLESRAADASPLVALLEIVNVREPNGEHFEGHWGPWTSGEDEVVAGDVGPAAVSFGTADVHCLQLRLLGLLDGADFLVEAKLDSKLIALLVEPVCIAAGGTINLLVLNAQQRVYAYRGTYILPTSLS